MDSLLIFLCPICIWLLLMVFLMAVFCAAQDGWSCLQRLHQIPCDRCRYFTGSHYLQCPVHPCRAFTETAIACLDFEPIPTPNQSKRHPKTFPHCTPIQNLYGHS